LQNHWTLDNVINYFSDDVTLLKMTANQSLITEHSLLLGVDLLGVDLLGVDLLGVDLLGVDLLGVDLLGVD